MTQVVFLGDEQFLLNTIFDLRSSSGQIGIKTKSDFRKIAVSDLKKSKLGVVWKIKKVPASNFESKHKILYSLGDQFGHGKEIQLKLTF